MFWTDSVEKRLYRAKLSDKNSIRSVVVEDDFKRTDDIAVDWVYNNVYWASGARRTISVTNLEGDFIFDVVDDDLENPQSLAVHPKKGWMFWSDWGNISKIEKSGMDGSNRIVLVTDNVVWPTGITLDLVMERIFWLDAKLHIIGSVGVDGSLPNIIRVSSSSLHHQFRMSVMEDSVFWSESGPDTSSIYQADKADGTQVKLLTTAKLVRSTEISTQTRPKDLSIQHHQPMSVTAYHQLMQPSSPNLCLARPILCSHICVPAPAPLTLPSTLPTTCLCPRQYSRLEDHSTCVFISTKSGDTETRQADVKTVSKEVLKDTTVEETEGGNLTGLLIGFLVVLGVLISVVDFTY